MTIYYGVDYYPEHDPEARWATDADLIARAGFTVVRLAEFAWSRIEPEAGRRDFAWLDRAITMLVAQGLKIVLGTPTAAPPQWLAAAHPEILRVDSQGRTAAPESRRFVCTTSPMFRTATTQIVTAMAERYGQHPSVIGWQIDNEFGCHKTTRCFCSACHQAFCTWLQARYGTLDALNTAWGLVFWGREYSDWAQVKLPGYTPAYHSPGHVLDAYRFASQEIGVYQQLQAAILRDYAPGRIICHNYMANFDEIDYADLSKSIDLVAWDNYVADGVQWHDTARYHDMMRGYKHLPFWVVESPPGHVNWTTYNPDLRPREARLRSLQAVAHGADGLFYFQWRAFRSGGEQYHSAVLPHDGLPGRLYHEAAALGDELALLGPLLDGTTVQAQVAIIADMDSYWALQHQPHSALLADPQVYVRPWYEALCRHNLPVEFCQPTDDLSAYRLVIAPTLHVLQADAAANLQRYVAQGGALILGPRTGFKQPTNQVTSLPLPGLLAELAGVRVAEWSALAPGDQRVLAGDMPEIAACAVTGWRELLELRGAEALAYYADGYDAGQVAIAANRYGQGETWYVGALGDELAAALIAARVASLGITGLLMTPNGVEVCVRSGNDRQVLFLFNHTDTTQTVQLPQVYHDLLNDRTLEGTLVLSPIEVAVIAAAPA